jgi:ATP synthase protein I
MSVNKINKREKKKIVYALTMVTQIGITMLVPIFMCIFLGIWLMKYVDNPLVIVFFSFFGFAVAFRNTYILVSRMFIKDKEKEDAEYEYFKKMEQERIDRLGK